MSSVIIFFLLFLLPFIILPFGATQFETPKVIFAEGGIIALLLVSFFTKTVSFKKNKLQMSLFGILILLTLLELIFFKTNISFFGNAIRMQGIFLLWLLLLFSLLSSQFSLKKIPWFIYGALIAGEAIVTFFLPINESQRYVGTLGEPNALAAFAIFVWPFVFFGIKKFTKLEIVSIVFTLLLVSGILFLSGSRSALIAFVIQIVCIVLLKTKLSLTKTIIVCLSLYAVSYMFPFLEHIPYENRTEIWHAAVIAGSISPIVGNGFGNTEIALHNAAHHLGLAIQYYYVDSAHNIFLDFWVQGGLIGISVLLTLVIVTLTRYIQKNNMRNITLLLGMLTVLSFNPASVVGLLGFWWLIGQEEI